MNFWTSCILISIAFLRFEFLDLISSKKPLSFLLSLLFTIPTMLTLVFSTILFFFILWWDIFTGHFFPLDQVCCWQFLLCVFISRLEILLIFENLTFYWTSIFVNLFCDAFKLSILSCSIGHMLKNNHFEFFVRQAVAIKLLRISYWNIILFLQW